EKGWKRRKKYEGASLIPAGKVAKLPKVIKAIGNVGKTGSKKGKQGEKIAKSSQAKQIKARDKGESGSKTQTFNSNMIRHYVRDIEIRTGRSIPRNQREKLKEALRSKEYKKLTPEQTR